MIELFVFDISRLKFWFGSIVFQQAPTYDLSEVRRSLAKIKAQLAAELDAASSKVTLIVALS